jgi:hypothetical protein
VRTTALCGYRSVATAAVVRSTYYRVLPVNVLAMLHKDNNNNNTPAITTCNSRSQALVVNATAPRIAHRIVSPWSTNNNNFKHRIRRNNNNHNNNNNRKSLVLWIPALVLRSLAAMYKQKATDWLPKSYLTMVYRSLALQLQQQLVEQRLRFDNALTQQILRSTQQLFQHEMANLRNNHASSSDPRMANFKSASIGMWLDQSKTDQVAHRTTTTITTTGHVYLASLILVTYQTLHHQVRDKILLITCLAGMNRTANHHIAMRHMNAR